MTRQVFPSGGPFEPVYGYSRAVRAGNQVHVAGTCAQGDALDGDTYEQARNALSIIETALNQAGASFKDVVRTVAYITNIDEKELVAKAHLEAFADVMPAGTLVEVSRLADPRMTVEIEAYAVLDE